MATAISVLMLVLGGLLLLLGFLGCVVPMLPGPLLGYLALWVLWAFGHSPGVAPLLWGGVAMVAATGLDYLLPAVFARRFECGKSGIFGCLLGTVIGMFFLPFGIILGPFLGAVAGELIGGRNFRLSLRGGVGALLGFVAGTLGKFVAVALCAYWFLMAVWR